MAERATGDGEQRGPDVINAHQHGGGTQVVARSIGVVNFGTGRPPQDELAASILLRRREEQAQLGIGDRRRIQVRWTPPDDSVRYLRFSGPQGAAAGWDPVLAELRDNPDGPLRKALSTPLMVALAAAVHGERGASGASGPDTLLDSADFPTADRVERHLLTAFLPSVYPRPSHARRARRWLAYVAHDLKERRTPTPNLAWWELGTTLPLRQRTAVIAFLAGLSFAFVTAVGNIPVDLIATSHGLGFAVRRGLVVGTLHGLLLGAACGFVYHRASGNDALKPSPIEITLRRDAVRRLRDGLSSRIAVGSLVALAGAVAIVAVDRSVVPWLGLDDGLGGGLVSAAQLPLIFGIGTGLVLAVTAWLEAPVDVDRSASCVDLLRMNRRNVHAHIAVWALVFGFIAWFGGSFTETPLRSLQLGLVFGVEGAFGGGLGYGLCLTAWGQWIALARIWLPLTGRLPWRLVTFLEDACERRALRRAGAVYQFRHARLRDHLTEDPGPGIQSRP
ncbi:hypothetical protein ACFWIJ_02385 [Streptomyces sp. NPDC127079]|uniref:hypothetical protein n=1 Tax=Streptomyces sp. NPDC127079 TaxID=3347132 RepID=UPI00364724AA